MTSGTTVSMGLGAMNTTIERVEKHLAERIDDVRVSINRAAVNRPETQVQSGGDVLADAPSTPDPPEPPRGGGGGGGGEREHTVVDPAGNRPENLDRPDGPFLAGAPSPPANPCSQNPEELRPKPCVS